MKVLERRFRNQKLSLQSQKRKLSIILKVFFPFVSCSSNFDGVFFNLKMWNFRFENHRRMWQIQLRVLFSHKPPFFNQSWCALYLNFIEIGDSNNQLQHIKVLKIYSIICLPIFLLHLFYLITPIFIGWIVLWSCKAASSCPIALTNSTLTIVVWWS